MTFRQRYPNVSRLIVANFTVSFLALAVGGFLGLIQGLHRTDYFRGFIRSSNYYDVLTGHGVLMVLVFTTFFITGLFTYSVTRSLERPLQNLAFSWAWFGLMTVGAICAGLTIFGPFIPGIELKSRVLFTFYAPLQAHPLFYTGLALIVVGSWMAVYDYFRTYWDWRSDHPNERIPLQTFMVQGTGLLWLISSAGVAVEVVFFLLPWSLGWIEHVDPMLTRTLFWYFGHPVVYFWLLPAYLVWYTILPKLAGGRLFSDPLARVVFILFLLLSTPVGFHHQYVDPGIPAGFKFIAMTNTMFLLLPSFLTAFTVIASIEYGARQRGGKGWFRWLGSLPWTDPAFSGCFLAGVMFAAGGFSGMINAGMNINYLIHNTLWVPGHFHLTVGTASALTFMAISYWILPQVTDKPLQWKGLASIQPYVWFIGMFLMSNAMHRLGLGGQPRRTAQPEYRGVEYSVPGGVEEAHFQVAIGGTILFISLTMFVLVLIRTFFTSRDANAVGASHELPEPLSSAEDGPEFLDNWWIWVGIALLLIILAYSIPLGVFLSDGILTPGVDPRVP